MAPGMKRPEHLTWDAAVRAHRAGKRVYETTPSGAKRLVNPDRRRKRAIARRLGITSPRQWRKHVRNARAVRP